MNKHTRITIRTITTAATRTILGFALKETSPELIIDQWVVVKRKVTLINRFEACPSRHSISRIG